MTEYTFTEESIAKAMADLPPVMFVDRFDHEWVAMWDTLARLPLNSLHSTPKVCEHKDGEVWQYMGSFAHSGRWVHEFRHRCHPATGKREDVRIPSTLGFRAAPVAADEGER
jgi:hypothetical protein